MEPRPPFENPAVALLAQEMVRQLTETSGLNEYMAQILPFISEVLGAGRISLVDYYEHTDHFDLLLFEGYPTDARHQLQRNLSTVSYTHLTLPTKRIV